MKTPEARKGRLTGIRVHVVSRCSWTLFNFRRRLIHGIVAREAEVVALGACDDGFDTRLRDEGINARHVPVSREGVKLMADIRLFFAFLRIFRIERPHVVHAFTIKPSIYATLAAALSAVPARIVTITGLGHAFTTAGGVLRWIVSRLYRFALARADVVFFQNRDDLELFVQRKLVSPGLARLIAGSGVDLEKFKVTPLPVRCGQRPVFLMIARLLREKGIREYLQAARALRVKYQDVRFQILGGVDRRNPSALEEAEVEALRRANDVTWIDEVDDVRPYVSEADVIVLPSYREGLPRSLLEGAAMGRALIATDVPGCREVIMHEHNGLLVPRADASALANAMERLIGNPDEIARFGARSRRLVEERFDERKVIEQTVSAYIEILSRKSQSARFLHLE